METFFTLKYQFCVGGILKLISNSKLVGSIKVEKNLPVCQRKLLKQWLKKNLKHKYSPRLNSWRAIEDKIKEAGYVLKHVHIEENQVYVYVIYKEK